MSEKFSRHSSKTSRRQKEDSSKSRIRRNSYQNTSKHKHGTKSPHSKNFEIDDLLKKRHSLKQELERLEHKTSKSKYSSKESKKRKYSEENNIHVSRSSKSHQERYSRKDMKSRELTPEYQDTHLDSEDEESIIEQRRKQRKQLLDKLNGDEPNSKLENKNNVENDETSNDKLDCDTNNKHLSATNTKNNSVTDMFSEKDDFDPKNVTGATANEENNSQLTDNWDDADGYYNIRSGDIINKQYTLKDILGQGVFANVVRAQDNNEGNSHVAIKIVRNNELMYKTSLKEISILKEINEADPENKYHCVKFITNFMHKGHLCLVLESLHMDLRAVIKKYGKHHGIHMKALMSYSRQLFLALRLLKKIGIVHADIKPDNILVNEKKNILKLCDFGSAAKLDENDSTPYLVSRFYRAPEIILGIPYNHGIDIWSTACTIYEMATGKIMFTGSSNNKMLKCFMDLKGRIPSKLIRKGKFKDQHFNYNNNFLLHKKDEFSGRDKVVEICNISIVRDLYKDLQKSCKNLTSDEEKKLTQLKDLLEKMLTLDSNHRSSVNDCLRHQFIHDQLQK